MRCSQAERWPWPTRQLKTNRDERYEKMAGVTELTEGDGVLSIAQLAAHMPTKLWFNRIEDTKDHKYTVAEPLQPALDWVLSLNETREKDGRKPLDEMDVAVICGQLTICHELLSHLWKEHYDKKAQRWTDDDARDLFERAAALWNKAQEHPALLLDQRKKSAGVAD